MKIDIYYTNICKHAYKKNMKNLWCTIVPKINVEQTEGNEGSYFYLYPFWGLNFKKLLCVHQVNKFFKNFLN
jgi:hypothetical protein